ncbi:MAG TPA: hypothetical protein VLF40_06255 [Candidatus Saccharimonadales bacterium]|nr:hypothetical protein [Candidatus Saccharimonadales bacterium]
MSARGELAAIELPAELTFADYQALTLPTVQYTEAPDPELLLRSGLVEEATELLSADPADSDAQHKEVGDMLWYLTEVARFRGVPLAGGEDTLDAHQLAFSAWPTLPVYTQAGELVDLAGQPHANVAIAVLRLVDTLSPESDELWHGYHPALRPNLQQVLRNALVSVCQFATAHEIRLDEAARRALQKVYGRPRRPHVVEDAAQIVTADPERLATHPAAQPLLGRLAVQGFGTATQAA